MLQFRDNWKIATFATSNHIRQSVQRLTNTTMTLFMKMMVMKTMKIMKMMKKKMVLVEYVVFLSVKDHIL